MTEGDLQNLRRALEAKHYQLSDIMRNRDEIVIEKAPDVIDEVQLAGERELAIYNLDRDATVIREVRRALVRISDGSYGICLHCDESISPKRLAAVAWAAYCIKCQEQMDRHEIQVSDTDGVFADAA